ncbi:RNA chaperone ProQ [Aliidiomarina taiwanensis]|uniref:RNA chaperone ProQ n=1 Tax=Aliidiomarina taiwanensis TaxID=946228 RepID=A0A432XAS7_9GAMM|nr:RNA chaperone ProQ [Aliidiomarina taiwanensis]RUO44459.1 RNA chaperone ProQ [Aliidiomarina taiwanensis]
MAPAAEETKRLPNSKAVIAYLAELFPACFTTSGDALPLKIGIFEDLAKRLENDEKVSKTRLRTALRQYTNSWRYLRSVKAGAVRVDLDGAEAGVIEAEHEAHAQETLAASQAKVQEAKKAQREANKKEAEAKQPRRTPKRAVRKGTKPVRTKKAEPKPKAEVALKETVDATALTVGQRVALKLGNNPMEATVTTIDKSEAQVQLDTGMTIKVSIAELHQV